MNRRRSLEIRQGSRLLRLWRGGALVSPGSAGFFDAPGRLRHLLDFGEELVDVEAGDKREDVEAEVVALATRGGVEHQEAGLQKEVAHGTVDQADDRAREMPKDPFRVP